MESQSHAFVAGLFVILLGLLVLGGAFWLGSQKGPAGLPIDLLTTHSVAGLKVGAPVRFRGVDVGRVDSIAFDPQQLGQIRVRISVDRAAPLSGATYAKLAYQGINGVALIQLDDDPRKSAGRLLLGTAKVPQMELQAGLLERAEDDVRDVLLKAARVAVRLETLLSDDNQKRLMALVDSLQQTSKRYSTLGREFEPSAKALPDLVQQATRTVAQAREVVDAATKLAADTDRKLVVLDTVTEAARQLTQVAYDLHTDTLPRVKGLTDEVVLDARAQTDAAPGQRQAAELHFRPATVASRPGRAWVCGERGSIPMMMRPLAPVLALSALSGCSLLGSQEPPKTAFDFGPPVTHATAVSRLPAANVVVYDLTAPALMDRSSMYYRLAYKNATNPLPYARSEWVMSPAALLTERLRSRLGESAPAQVRQVSTGGASRVYALHGELFEFEQIFDRPGSSRGVLRLRATLEGDGSHAQRTFAVERPAPTADAAGGVSALVQCSDDLADAIGAWLSTVSGVETKEGSYPLQ